MIYILGVLAVWRLTLLITDEEGPFSLFSRIRDRIDPIQLTWVGRGVRCMWCVSFWIGWLVAWYLWITGFISGVEVPIVALALSAGAIGWDKAAR